MADIYVRSTDGADADSGATWALAKATLTGAAAIDAAGDRIFLSSSHAETTAAAVTFALAGTLAQPTMVLSVNDSAAPPTASSSGASITTTGTSGITFTGTSIYVEGLQFFCGTGAGSPAFSCSTATGRALFKNCFFSLVATGARVNLGAATAAFQEARNCTFRASAAGNLIAFSAAGRGVVSGGGFVAGSATPTGVFSMAASSRGFVESFDMSTLAATVNIVQGSPGTFSSFIIRNSRLPVGWTGSLVSGTVPLGVRIEMHNCDSGDTRYRLQVADHVGTVRSETAIVRSGGATDGETPISWILSTNANASPINNSLASPEIALWNAVIGAPITVAVEVATDGVTLNDSDAWIEVQQMGTDGTSLGTVASGQRADMLATAVAHPTSTETWVSLPGTPVRQRLLVTFTPREAGFLQAVIRLARASTTIYVDPLLTVT